jgi:hypothetical protein
MAQFAWRILSAHGHRVLKDKKPLKSEQENLAELKQQARTFLDKQEPILKALGVELQARKFGTAEMAVAGEVAE